MREILEKLRDNADNRARNIPLPPPLLSLSQPPYFPSHPFPQGPYFPDLPTMSYMSVREDNNDDDNGYDNDSVFNPK